VAIYRLLQGAAFGPEEIAVMAEAYETTLKRLHLVDRSDPVTQIIAKKIIEIAGTDERDPSRIASITIKELGVPTGN
jgi:hypothetical protein